MKDETQKGPQLSSFSDGIRLPELIKCVERLTIPSEKKFSQEDTLHLDKGDGKLTSRETFGDTGRLFRDDSASNDNLRIVLSKLFQYQLDEDHVPKESPPTCADAVRNEIEKSRELCLPNVFKDSQSARQAALLDQIVNTSKMKREIIIPTMVVHDVTSSRNSCGTSLQLKSSKSNTTAETNSQKKKLPHLNYAHDDGLGKRRNLPGQPELIRLLTDPEISLQGDGSLALNSDQNGTNQLAFLSLYGNSTSPPLIEKQKQKRARKRKIVCKFCRREPGDHQKWCIYYDFGKDHDENTEVAEHHTEDDIQLAKPHKIKTPTLERSKTSIDDYKVRTDLPDYRPLHRDVYLRALADSRARLIMSRTHDFVNQLTKPFVFSYFSKMNGPRCKRGKFKGMEHIFGTEETDFTQYYKLLVSASHKKD